VSSGAYTGCDPPDVGLSLVTQSLTSVHSESVDTSCDEEMNGFVDSLSDELTGHQLDCTVDTCHSEQPMHSQSADSVDSDSLPGVITEAVAQFVEGDETQDMNLIRETVPAADDESVELTYSSSATDTPGAVPVDTVDVMTYSSSATDTPGAVPVDTVDAMTYSSSATDTPGAVPVDTVDVMTYSSSATDTPGAMTADTVDAVPADTVSSSVCRVLNRAVDSSDVVCTVDDDIAVDRRNELMSHSWNASDHHKAHSSLLTGRTSPSTGMETSSSANTASRDPLILNLMRSAEKSFDEQHAAGWYGRTAAREARGDYRRRCTSERQSTAGTWRSPSSGDVINGTAVNTNVNNSAMAWNAVDHHRALSSVPTSRPPTGMELQQKIIRQMEVCIHCF